MKHVSATLAPLRPGQLLVRDQLGLLTEALATVTAVIRGLARVRPLVDDEVRDRAEALRANPALGGFSPVWTRLCVMRLARRLKHLIQSPHLQGRCPVWTRWCMNSYDLRLKPRPQSEQRTAVCHCKHASAWPGLSCDWSCGWTGDTGGAAHRCVSSGDAHSPS